jgi:hypothetical protein
MSVYYLTYVTPMILSVAGIILTKSWNISIGYAGALGYVSVVLLNEIIRPNLTKLIRNHRVPKKEKFTRFIKYFFSFDEIVRLVTFWAIIGMYSIFSKSLNSVPIPEISHNELVTVDNNSIPTDSPTVPESGCDFLAFLKRRLN